MRERNSSAFGLIARLLHFVLLHSSPPSVREAVYFSPRSQLRMARAGDVVLLDHPADTTGPRCIHCYLVEVQDFAAAAPGGEAKKFKLEPQRLLYSLQRPHTATPPDFRLQLVRDPQQWFDMVSLTLLAELSRGDPQLRDRLRAATAP